VRFRYLGAISSGYTETGSASNLTVGSRVSHAAEVRFQFTAPTSTSGAMRYGIDAQYSSAKTPSMSVAGSALTISTSDNGFAARAFIGFDFASSGSDGRSFFGSSEFGLSTSGQATAVFSIKKLF
jgi:hypothetical protein